MEKAERGVEQGGFSGIKVTTALKEQNKGLLWHHAQFQFWSLTLYIVVITTAKYAEVYPHIYPKNDRATVIVSVGYKKPATGAGFYTSVKKLLINDRVLHLHL